MYSFGSRVRYSEVDDKGRLTFSSILDYFQDCSSFQSEDLQVGISYLKREQVAWVLVSWRIEVERYPVHGEEITVETWPYAFKGFYGSRNFLMKDQMGRCLARADSLWVLIDTEKGRPARLLPRMKEVYGLEPALPMEGAPRKIKLPGDMEEMEPFPVHKFHLDTTHHVNNGKYIQMAQEYLPPDFEVGCMRAEYKMSAVYGDIIYPAVAFLEHKMVTVLGNESGKPYAVIELEKKHDEIR